jgi:hypothetical protein
MPRSVLRENIENVSFGRDLSLDPECKTPENVPKLMTVSKRMKETLERTRFPFPPRALLSFREACFLFDFLRLHAFA